MLVICPHPNITIDIWTDATMRSFVGYMVHAINDNWELVTHTLGFQQIKVRHTGLNIKAAYDDLINEYGIFYRNLINKLFSLSILIFKKALKIKFLRLLLIKVQT